MMMIFHSLILMFLLIAGGCNPFAPGKVVSGNTQSDPVNAFTITASQAGNGKIGLAWEPSEGAVHYEILYKLIGEKNFINAGTAASPFELASLTGGSTYVVKVRAFSLTESKDSTNFIVQTVTNNPSAPLSSPIKTATLAEDTAELVTLSYTDLDGDLASSCQLSLPSDLYESTPCSCDGMGVCQVGVQGTANFNGNAKFSYTVTAGGDVSNLSEVIVPITSVDDIPVANNLNLPSVVSGTEKLITLSYNDNDVESATACTISGLQNLIVSTSCSCQAGVCTVGVKGAPGFSGAVNFHYKVSVAGVLSNLANVSFTVGVIDTTMMAQDITPPAFNEDIQSLITLNYTDTESDLATGCSVASLSHVTETTACSCNGAGICKVGVTGDSNYNGAASFLYTVTRAGSTSESATASFSINPVDDAPVALNITPVAFLEDTPSLITLSYTDMENDFATSCALTSSTHLVITQACACDGAGVCKMEIQGDANYYGAADFNFTVTSLAQTSNAASATLTILPVDDAPVADAISPPAFNEDTISLITLSYSDGENTAATLCTLSNLSNISITTSCSCSAGVCTVSVKGALNFNGVAGFDYKVKVGVDSNTAHAILAIDPVDDAPVSAPLTQGMSEDVESIITLSYSDQESNLATSCTLSSLVNVTETLPCSCDGAGLCTVGVTGTTNYNGAASFSYSVQALSLNSNVSLATLAITAVNDPPVTANITPANFIAGTQSLITLPYSDIESANASACAVAGLNNVTISAPCSCTAGVCTVGVTGSPGIIDPASFTYTVTVATQVSNSSTASFNLICPMGYVEILANAGLGVSGFCVMKFEAKDSGTEAVSTAAGLPFVSISQTAAKTECTDLGTKYDLISNPEWVVIARDIENTNSNWSGLSVGSGAVNRGHSDNSPASALTVTNVNDPYNQTGNSTILNPEQKRNHELSSGEIIWDFAGNVYEWVDWSLTAGLQIVTPANKAYGNPPDSAPVGAWREFTVLNTNIGVSDEMAVESWQSWNPLFTSSEGMGQYFSGTNDNGGTAHRGGSWNQGSVAGIYTLSLNNAPALQSIGFRCVYRP